MKKNLSLALLLLIVITSPAFSQTVIGEWYGVGKVNRKGEHSNYLAEMVLKQRGNFVTGTFNYYFKSAKLASVVVGTFEPKSKLLELKITPVLNHKAKNINGADCPMEGSFTMYPAKDDTTMYGQFNPLYEYRYTCGAITVRFRKVSNKEPERPREEHETVKEEIVEKPVAKPLIDPAVALLNKRAFEVINEVEVNSDTLLATLYDNSEVDGDTVSMFYDKKLITHKSMLSDKPLNFKLAVKDSGINELSMYAENLGTLPPNTALLIIMDGEKRLEFNLASNFIKNSTLRFRKKKKEQTAHAL